MSPIVALAEANPFQSIALQGPAENAWLIPLLPLVAALLIAFVTRAYGKLSAGVSIAAICGSLGLALPILSDRLRNAGGPMEIAVPWFSVSPDGGTLATVYVGLLIDNLTAAMLVMVCFIGLLIQIYSYSYITKEVTHFPTQGSASVSRFFAYLSLFVFSMLGLVLSNNLLQIYVFWELVGLCSYFLIGFWYFKSSAALASKKAFVVTKFADIGFLLGVLSLGLGAGTFNFLKLEEAPQTLMNLAPWSLDVALVLVFCGAIGKSAQAPLQMWLPDAMEGPTPVSALIHAATMVAAGVYLVARLFPLFSAAPEAALIVAYIGAFTALIAGSIAVVQNDIKRVLAYSTVSQLGFMMAALGCNGMTAGAFHLITHAFFKALLFLGSGAVIVACHSNDMWSMGGLKKYMPITHATFLAGCLALSGFPGFAGFWSKDEVLGEVFHSHHYFIFGILLFTAFLTAFYVSRMYCITFLGEYRGSENAGEFAGPVPPLSLPAPLEPSKDAFNMERHWTEARVPMDEHHGGLDPACLGALSEHVPHADGDHKPHEVSPMMYIPLFILSFFAVFLGFTGMPDHQFGGVENYFHHFIHAVEVPGHPAGEFMPSLMVGSAFVAVLGLFLGWKLYGTNPLEGERIMRTKFRLIWPILQQKWYFDHAWAILLSRSLYRDANRIGFVEENVVDSLVYKAGETTYDAGSRLRQEQSGLVQKYGLQIALASLVLILSVGVIEPQFLWSMANLMSTLFEGGR